MATARGLPCASETFATVFCTIGSIVLLSEGGSVAGKKRLELIANGRVADYARRIEHPGGARDEHAAAGPEGHAQCAQHRQPVILREHGAEPARRRAQDRDMAPAEHPRDIARSEEHTSELQS